MEENLLRILNLCDLSLNSLEEIENIKISRKELIRPDLYKKVKEKIINKEIKNFKKELSSSFYTCLHNDVEKKQKWPLVNLIRQFLKHYKYRLVPIRECDGYTKDKKKRFKRYYIVKKIKVEKKDKKTNINVNNQ